MLDIHTSVCVGVHMFSFIGCKCLHLWLHLHSYECPWTFQWFCRSVWDMTANVRKCTCTTRNAREHSQFMCTGVSDTYVYVRYTLAHLELLPYRFVQLNVCAKMFVEIHMLMFVNAHAQLRMPTTNIPIYMQRCWYIYMALFFLKHWGFK